MKYIDAHMHAETLSWLNIEEMAMNGIRAAVSPPVCPWRGGLKIDSETHISLIHRLLRHESWRTEENQIKLFVAVGVAPVSVPDDVEVFFNQMEEFLEDARVVAVGELGFDPRSQKCKDLKKQEEVIRIQLKKAKQKNLPVIFHTPPDAGQVKLPIKGHEKRMFMDKSIELVKEAGLAPEMVVLDHLDTEEWVKFALDHGCYAGISIQQWRGVGPEQAARWAQTFGPERILLNTDAGVLISDHLGVPRAAFCMRKNKMPDETIRKITYENPIRFYRLPLS